MEPNILQFLWFLLFGVLVAGYAVLDGFDLGVGVLSLFRKNPEEKRLMINAIGPVWDGNEVWLLTAGGALFAAFPPVYATVFSGFYLALMLLLVFLILRAVSMEFRGKVDSSSWRSFWDLAFGIGSFGPALLFGVAVGNIMRGIALDANGLYTGSFLDLLNPYALVIGLLSLVAFTCQGALYMWTKSEGELAGSMQTWATRSWFGWVGLYVVATLFTFFGAGHLLENALARPLTWLVVVALLLSFAYLPVAIRGGQRARALVTSSLALVSMIGLVGLGLYPRWVPSTLDPAFSLTVAGDSSTDRTLTTMLVIALVGMPLVLGYTAFIYRQFKGKVVLTEDSY